jgi:hypothetical protein
MDADSHDIARLNVCRIQPFQGLIADFWIPAGGRRGSRQHVQPTGSYYRRPEGEITGIDEMD